MTGYKGAIPGQVIIGILFTFLMSTSNTKIVLEDGSLVFNWWAKLPVAPVISFYLYNVTNSDEFLKGSKPVVDELGPYVYQEKWERRNIIFNDNGTVSYNLEKIYYFNEHLSHGLDVKDIVNIPNMLMLGLISLFKHLNEDARLELVATMESLKSKPFIQISVEQLLWGYDDPIITYIVGEDPNQNSSVKFGLLNPNGTLGDRLSMFTGANDITKYGLIDTLNGMSHLDHWHTDCSKLLASDGSLFPPNPTRNTTLYLYDNDLCRTLPLVFEKDVKRKDNIPSWRFSPPPNVLESGQKNPENHCYCPCGPSGLFNVSLCQADLPVMVSFPHFYLADDSLRYAFDGISPPNPEKHKYYVDVQPEMGFSMSTKIRLQLNLAVSHVDDVKEVATFPDIIFPIMWFEESVNGLPEELIYLRR